MRAVNELFSKFSKNKKNKLVFLPALVITGGIFVVGFLILGRPSSTSTEAQAPPLNPNDVQIDSSFDFAQGGDVNKDGKFSGGDTVKFSFTLKNVSKNAGKFVSVNTGIPRSFIYNIRNIHGTTGFITNETVEFKNVVVLPDQTQDISFEAGLVYPASDMRLTFEPMISDDKGKEIAKGERKDYGIFKVDTQSQVITMGVGN